MDTRTRTTDTTTSLADLLRSSAAWLHAAADALDAGDLDQAAQFARLGALGADGTPARIDALTEGSNATT